MTDGHADRRPRSSPPGTPASSAPFPARSARPASPSPTTWWASRRPSESAVSAPVREPAHQTQVRRAPPREGLFSSRSTPLTSAPRAAWPGGGVGGDGGSPPRSSRPERGPRPPGPACTARRCSRPAPPGRPGPPRPRPRRAGPPSCSSDSHPGGVLARRLLDASPQAPAAQRHQRHVPGPHHPLVRREPGVPGARRRRLTHRTTGGEHQQAPHHGRPGSTTRRRPWLMARRRGGAWCCAARSWAWTVHDRGRRRLRPGTTLADPEHARRRPGCRGSARPRPTRPRDRDTPGARRGRRHRSR